MLLLPKILLGNTYVSIRFKYCGLPAYIFENFLPDIKVNLYRNNYATFKEIKTKTVEVSGNKDDKSKKAKLFITLKKSPQFAENMAKFNKIREENEALKKEETKQ